MSVNVPARATSLLLAVFLLGACGTAPRAPSSTGVDVDVEQVYALAGRSLRSSGVYHVTITATVEAGEDSYGFTRELWIDAAHDTARDEMSTTGGRADGPPQRSVTLVAGGVRWVDGTPRSPVTCHGESAAVGELLGCPDASTTSTTTAQRDVVDGRQHLVLLSHDVTEGSDSAVASDARTDLDPVSGLPERRTESGTIDDGSRHPMRATRVFRPLAVPPGSLPAGFFDPTSLGWHGPDLVSEIPTGVPIYWLGLTYHPSAALPPLTLGAVTKSPGGPGYSAILEYAPVADRFGPAMLTIQEFTRAKWDSSKIVIGVPRCPGQSALVLAKARVELRCSEGGHGISAFVRVAEAVLVVNAPSVGTASGMRRSPYDERAALLTTIAALSLRKES